MPKTKLLPGQMAPPGPEPFTYQDYLGLPDDGRRYEILEGELYTSPSPSVRHQLVCGNLYTLLRAWVEAKSLGTVFFAPLDVVISEINVLQSDLLFLRHDRLALLTAANLAGAPDLVVEILSPGSEARDRRAKKAIYQRFAVPHFWLLDPETRQLEEFTLSAGRYRLRTRLSGAASFAPALFPGLAIDLAQLWA